MRRVSSGRPEPLGVTLERHGALERNGTPGPDDGVNVAVFSAHASAIEFCLFDAKGEIERERIVLPARTGDIVHGFIAGVRAGDRYGLRAYGAYDPARGQVFNPAKLLVDPYVKAIDRRFVFDPAMRGGAGGQGARDEQDSASLVPKGIVRDAASRSTTRRPQVPWADTVIYELHVRGFTQTHPGIPPPIRGTCAGLAHPAAIAHLQRLGVTSVELMPIAAAIDEPHLVRAGLSNYWGYNAAALFVPDPRLAPGGITELTACVADLHAAGIEVILDVALNHSGEGDAFGPTLSLRGLDNVSYYRMAGDNPLRYVDDTGCGNTLALDRPPMLRLALDVLRYYAEVAGVDGFRFDLATTLGRRDSGFDADAPLLQAIAQDPALRDLKLIAEPWDVGPGGHRLGAFPATWGEWNDRFRDTARRFWRGDAGLTGDFATRFAGSADIFAARSRPPSRSINFVTAHDGFTVADLVSYATKHNDANGEDNRDGTDANFSWNHGAEGPAADAAIMAARRRDVRNLLTTLLLARGTPMLTMGDELGRTQAGNNNAYAQDNALAWVDWSKADEDLIGFVARLIALRKRHATLRDERWLIGEPDDATGLADVEWKRLDGSAMDEADWSRADSRALVAVLYRGADTGGEPGLIGDRVAIAFNAADVAAVVSLPDAREKFEWRVALDTAAAGADTAAPRYSAIAAGDEAVAVGAHSIVVLAEEQSPAPTVLSVSSGSAGTSDTPAAFARLLRRTAPPDSAMLDRLAAAAGIAGDWWDVAGKQHLVTAETKQALLAAMNMPTRSTNDARAHLFALAEQRECRALPALLVGRDEIASRLPLARTRRGLRNPGRLRLRSTDRSTNERGGLLSFAFDELPGDVITALDGRRVERRMLTLPALPIGDYTLSVEGGDGDNDDNEGRSRCRLVIAPNRCFRPDALQRGGRRFGLAAHLYALRRRGDWGIGDFSTLAAAGEATARAGGSIVGLNPLHMLFPGERERASPYHPSDRRFLDPLYIDIESVPDFSISNEARRLFDTNRAQIAALAATAAVDYAHVWQLKAAALRACFAAFQHRSINDPLVAEFDQFTGAGGVPLQQFALFTAIAGAHAERDPTRWPIGLRRPNGPDAAAFARAHAAEIRFALYLQWLADRALGAAAAHARASGLTLGFFRDLAVGAASDGAEMWANPDGFGSGASIGAPPDPFSAAGQNWNLPPPLPGHMLFDAGSGFRTLLAANMRHAGALRIDHVMGLSRLFWIPTGAKTVDGAYVDYPFDTLLGLLARESVAARCLIVGEDLGTVPEGLRDKLSAADVLSYRVLWFERDATGFYPPARYPANAVTCVSTHDLPTIAGWWSGADLVEQQALGTLTGDAVDAAETDRDDARKALLEAIVAAETSPPLSPSSASLEASSPHIASITAAVHTFAGASPSALVLLQADDLAGETIALNLPGTDRERPNWRRKVSVAVDELWQTPTAIESLAGVDPARRNAGDADH